MRAVRWNAPEQLELVDADEPAAGPGQAVVEVANCGICGSDLHAYSHGFGARPGQVLGHELSGTVLDAPDVEGLAAGDRVTVRPLIPCGQCARCRAGDPQLCENGHAQNIGYASPGAFAERVLVPRAVVGETVFPLPDSVDDRGGALVEPLAVGLRAVRLCGDVAGRTVLVLGAGMIGLAVTRFLYLAGAGAVVVVDPAPVRREAALEFGADVVIDPLRQSTVKVLRELTGPGASGLGARTDAAIDCAGAPIAFADAVKSLRGGGTLVLAAIYGRRIELSLDRITEKELVLRGSFAYRDEFPAVIAAIAAGDVVPERFVSHTFPLERIHDAFQVQLDKAASLKVMVMPKPS
ncbi:MAG TPA: alcohol dehydrogenase catalytic domain-containing protein [Solirubrobacteraceae bacterium]|nr:alcohol dehydrogenase catalytic domain-containing protein [Solirubrobacteraceae bacterium]